MKVSLSKFDRRFTFYSRSKYDFIFFFLCCLLSSTKKAPPFNGPFILPFFCCDFLLFFPWHSNVLLPKLTSIKNASGALALEFLRSSIQSLQIRIEWDSKQLRWHIFSLLWIIDYQKSWLWWNVRHNKLMVVLMNFNLPLLNQKWAKSPKKSGRQCHRTRWKHQ